MLCQKDVDVIAVVIMVVIVAAIMAAVVTMVADAIMAVDVMVAEDLNQEKAAVTELNLEKV